MLPLTLKHLQREGRVSSSEAVAPSRPPSVFPMKLAVQGANVEDSGNTEKCELSGGKGHGKKKKSHI